MKTFQLEMRSYPQLAQNLPEDCDVMSTGPMGDCVSIIVLWNLYVTTYRNVRGYHGLGGLGAINLESLFNGLPQNDRVSDNHTTVVHCFLGTLAMVGSDKDNAKPMIRKYLNSARVYCHGGPQGFVDRNGVWGPA